LRKIHLPSKVRGTHIEISIEQISDDLTAPRHLEVTHEGQYSLAIKWDAPECGSIGEYQVELIGEESPFDVHRQTVTQPSVSVTNLLPATSYTVKIRAVDRQRRIGPWNADLLQAKTQGNPVPVSNGIRLVYKTDSDLRISWDPIDDERAQHYEVMAVEVLPESRRVERARVPPYVSGHTLSGLLPETKYIIGVVAFVDHEPKQASTLKFHRGCTTFKLVSLGLQLGSRDSSFSFDGDGKLARETTGYSRCPAQGTFQPPVLLSDNLPTPSQIIDDGSRHFTVRWRLPSASRAIEKFVVEYKLPNETAWRNTDITTVEKGVNEFSIVLPNMADTSLYTVRIVAIGSNEEVITRTEEVTVGAAAANACFGPAGVPEDVALDSAEATTLRFTWTKPDCDESVAPIDGYEYLIHETDQAPPHSGASYIGGTAVAIPDLRPSTKYSFRVRSRNANGHSPWSETIHVATEAEGISIVDSKHLTITNLKAEVWPRQKRQAKQSITDEGNVYKVRVVLSPPDVYLVWTPLPEHTNRIAYFKVAYKERAGTRWVRIVGRPDEFTCPPGIADRGDFCYRLQHFFFGVHYITRISYNLTSGAVLDDGSTLHFSLLQLAGVEEQPRFQLSISQPRIEQQGPLNVAYWSTTGDTSQLLGYQVDIRRDGDRDWHEQGAVVRSEPSQVHFRQSLGAVPVATYYLRVRALDSSMSTVATSPSTSFSVSCQRKYLEL
ncbi:fibronectin type III domain protein, partial [Oesophagostomum dentatum]